MTAASLLALLVAGCAAAPTETPVGTEATPESAADAPLTMDGIRLELRKLSRDSIVMSADVDLIVKRIVSAGPDALPVLAEYAPDGPYLAAVLRAIRELRATAVVAPFLSAAWSAHIEGSDRDLLDLILATAQESDAPELREWWLDTSVSLAMRLLGAAASVGSDAIRASADTERRLRNIGPDAAPRVVAAVPLLAPSHCPLLARALANLDWPATVPLLTGWLGDPAAPSEEPAALALSTAAREALETMKSAEAKAALAEWESKVPAAVAVPKAHPFDDVSYFPARRGNTWKYDGAERTMTWSVLNVTRVDAGYRIEIDQQVANKKTNAVLQEKVVFDLSDDGRLDEVGKDLRGRATRSARLFLPLEEGRTWQEASGDLTRVYTVVSRSYTLTSGTQTFTDVVKFTRQETVGQSRNELAWYVAPNVGLIRIESDGIIRYSLTSYEIAGNDLVRVDGTGS